MLTVLIMFHLIQFLSCYGLKGLSQSDMVHIRNTSRLCCAQPSPHQKPSEHVYSSFNSVVVTHVAVGPTEQKAGHSSSGIAAARCCECHDKPVKASPSSRQQCRSPGTKTQPSSSDTQQACPNKQSSRRCQHCPPHMLLLLFPRLQAARSWPASTAACAAR